MMIGPKTSRPTTLSEWTLISALLAVWTLALILASMILLPHWPDAVAQARIDFLGGALILAIFSILVMIAAFASPYLGTVKVGAMGASLDINGTNNGEVIVQAADLPGVVPN